MSNPPPFKRTEPAPAPPPAPEPPKTAADRLTEAGGRLFKSGDRWVGRYKGRQIVGTDRDTVAGQLLGGT